MATETAVDVVMPQMGVSVSEGTITKWLKREGEQVEADEPLLEISTDKVDTEVPSPASGTLVQILVQEGETVDVGTKLAQIGGSTGAPPAPAPPVQEPEATTEPVVEAPAPASAPLDARLGVGAAHRAGCLPRGGRLRPRVAGRAARQLLRPPTRTPSMMRRLASRNTTRRGNALRVAPAMMGPYDSAL